MNCNDKKDVSLDVIITTLKLEGKFNKLYEVLYYATSRGFVGQIAINKKRDNRKHEIAVNMKRVMNVFSNGTLKSFVREFGFDAVERSEELLELLFDRKDIMAHGMEIELYVLKFHNF